MGLCRAAAQSVLGGAYLRTTISSMAFWLMMPLLLAALIATDGGGGESRHPGNGYGSSGIVHAGASPTESRSLAGRKMAMAGREGGNFKGEGQEMAAGEAVHVSTADGGGESSGSDSEHADIHRSSSKRRLAAESTTSTFPLRGIASHHGSSRGRLLQSTSTSSSAWLEPHNAARSAVGVAGLSWSDEVAMSAAYWARQLANDCRLYNERGSKYGQNLYMRLSVGSINIQPSTVVGAWVAEKANYNYASNSCEQVCGHYTQVVWRETKQVGCAIASCTYLSYNAQIAVCRYNPPGNYNGEKPY